MRGLTAVADALDEIIIDFIATFHLFYEYQLQHLTEKTAPILDKLFIHFAVEEAINYIYQESKIIIENIMMGTEAKIKTL